MGITPTSNRTENYGAKVDTTQYTALIAALETQMKTNFATQTALVVAKQQEVAQLLDSEGVSCLVRGQYHAFGNRFYKAAAMSSGESFFLWGQVEIALWTGRGLSQVLLENIARTVFNWQPPVSP